MQAVQKITVAHSIKRFQSCDGQAGVIFDMHQKNCLTKYSLRNSKEERKKNKIIHQCDMKIFRPEIEKLKYLLLLPTMRQNTICLFGQLLSCMRHYLLCAAWHMMCCLTVTDEMFDGSGNNTFVRIEYSHF